MKKMGKRIRICVLICLLIWGIGLLRDREQLASGLIRLHVVANSDSVQDQNLKLKVRDAILQYIQPEMEKLTDMEAAKAYLNENLPVLRSIVNTTLQAAGVDTDATITLCREEFNARQYDTFSLPAGVYESLRVTIGEGAGKNWWCVAFPTLCVPATASGFEDAAVGAGFSPELVSTLTKEDCEIRFFLLDAIGTLENIFFAG